MNILKIKGILVQEFYITIRSVEVILDIMFFPFISIIVFGFLAVYLSGKTDPNIAYGLLFGMILWQVIYVTQYSVSVGSLWNIWSRNLSNLFIAPLSITEYISAHFLSGIVKALFILLIGSVTLRLFFGFNIFVVGPVNLFLYTVNLLLFAVTVGIAILGLIFRYGTRIQAFAWGILPLFQPLTAALFPLSVLPPFLRYPALFLPPTYVFEAMRQNLTSTEVNWQYMGISFGMNIFYLVLSMFFFRRMFRISKATGQFARNEG